MEALEDRDRVQIAGIARAAARSASECQLAAGGAVGGIAEEIKAEQGWS